jgi:hypothetical protein
LDIYKQHDNKGETTMYETDEFEKLEAEGINFPGQYLA